MRYSALLFALLFHFTGTAQQPDDAYIRDHFTKKEVMIPMRDGIKLFTAIYTPKDSSRTYPILMKRTPYSCAPYGTELVGNFQNMYLAREGYIFVFQDVRGKYMSEGDFVDVRPYIHKSNPAPPKAEVKKGKKKGKSEPETAIKPDIDEATDTYDTVDWLTGNLMTNNGKVGVYGISYPGFYATMSILAQHPAIKAVSPQAPVTD